MVNTGVVTAKRTSASDEQYTPAYAVRPLIKYLWQWPCPNTPVVWCPFDLEQSQYVQVLRDAGFGVIHSHISEGKDFFQYQPTEHYDIIISNGPFSQKDAILRRLHELHKPFAVLFPVSTLQGIKRFPYLEGHHIQYLGFDKRINFYTDVEQTTPQRGISFATCYLCSDFLPYSLIIEKLEV